MKSVGFDTHRSEAMRRDQLVLNCIDKVLASPKTHGKLRLFVNCLLKTLKYYKIFRNHPWFTASSVKASKPRKPDEKLRASDRDLQYMEPITHF